MTKHYALIIGNSLYDKLDQLLTPARDAEAMARVLGDPMIGDYEIQIEINQESGRLRWVIEDLFCHKPQKKDTILIYFSGHGLLNDASELLLATKDTDEKYLNSTSISANFIKKVMDECSSDRKIIILDSCHSGAFTSGFLKGELDTTRRARMEFGSGVAILTAARPLQYAYEARDNEVRGLSIFTRFLVEGLETGTVAKNNEDFITVNDLHDYVKSKMETLNLQAQSPRISTVDREGQIVIANNKSSSKFALSIHIEKLLKTKSSTNLKQAIPLLLQQTNKDNKYQARRAIGELKKLVNHSSQMVQNQAVKALKQINIPLQIPNIRFSNGKEIKSVKDWVQYIEQNKDIWLEASELLHSGLVEQWLTAINRPNLANAVRKITVDTTKKNTKKLFPQKRLIGLEKFQRIAGALPHQHKKDASTNLHQLIGQLIYWRLHRYRKSHIFEFEVINNGRGYMHGKLISKVEWLYIDKSYFGCLTHDKATVQFTVDYDRYRIYKPYPYPLDFLLD